MALGTIPLQHLGSQYPDVKFMHAYPGIVKTPIFHDLPWYARMGASGISSLLGTEPKVCAEHLLYAFLAEDTKPYKTGGASFTDNKGDPVKGKVVATQEQQDKVWQHTLQILQ